METNLPAVLCEQAAFARKKNVYEQFKESH